MAGYWFGYWIPKMWGGGGDVVVGAAPDTLRLHKNKITSGTIPYKKCEFAYV
jgi:hypothetical protein